MEQHPSDYIIEHATVAEITYADILKHGADTTDSGKSDYLHIEPTFIEINFGIFTKSSAADLDFPSVAVTQIDKRIILSCSCQSLKKKLCVHQAQVLQNIITQPYLRIFYDPALRHAKVKEAAKAYGLQNETNLDEFFQVEYVKRSVEIKPRIKELIKIDVGTSTYLQQQLLPRRLHTAPPNETNSPGKTMILVFRKHKYYGHLNIELYEGPVTKDGKVKNPLSNTNPHTYIWKTENIDDTKFFTGVSKFQHNHGESDAAADIEGLKAVVKNPLHLPVFFHDKDISENVTANSIVPVVLNVLNPDIRLSVFKKEPFYEVEGGLVIGGKDYPFKALNIQYSYFIKTGNILHLVADADMLRIIEYFKANNEKVIIHASKYNEFYQNILLKLEDKVTINYAYIKPATKKQIAQHHFDRVVERRIYLKDQDLFVFITPVVKYGNVEVPVFSRKQIHDTDVNGNVFKVERDNQLETDFTALILRQHPQFDEQLNDRSYFYLHKEKFLDENWFLNAFEEWRNQGIAIFGFNELKKNKLNPNKAVVSVNISSEIDWFNVAVTVKYGKQNAALKKINKSIKNGTKFVQLGDGTMGVLPEEWVKRFTDYSRLGEIWNDAIRISKSNFADINTLFEDEGLAQDVRNELAKYQRRFANLQDITEVEVSPDFKGELRDYQQQGLNWLNLLDELNFGGCLADDMGLGKTIQIIAFILLQRKKEKNNVNLVVVPTSLLFNWQAEVAKFAPSIKLFTYYGANRIKNHIDFNKYEIILTTYGTLLSDIRLLKDFSFNYIFLDESQAIKNPGSQRYKAARMLQSRNKIVLTGTPVENNTFDIYGQLSFACPGLLGNREYFHQIYSNSIDKFEDSRRVAELQQKIKPFILRRTKKQVAKELPEKTEVVIYCEMGEEQREIYDRCEKELRDYINEKNPDELKKNSMHVLTGLTKLRQICNAPKLVKDEQYASHASAKIEVLMEQIESKSPDHKILVFSQFVSMLDLIKKELQTRNIPFEYLTGQTKNRSKAVNDFEQKEEVRVFLISLKAGGTGLNLTQADYVYLVDPWWNPAVENQAIDRCYRIGQKKNVIAVRLICPDTVEEKIMKLQATKTQLVNDLIKTDGTFIKSLNKRELMALLD